MTPPLRAVGRRRVLALAGGALLVALLLAAAWAVPRLTDWTARREALAQLASERIGRPVTLAGPVRLALLPRPMLEAEGVTVGGAGATSGFGARALRLRLDGGALFLGRLVPREVSLVGAELRLPWPPVDEDDGGLGGLGWPARLSGLSASVEDGRVTLGGAVLEGVRARLDARGGSEAIQASGEFAWAGREMGFGAVFGRPGLDGVVPVDLTVTSAGASLSLRGVLREDGGGLEGGTVEASGPDLSAWLPGPPGPFRARGRLAVQADLLVADELFLELAGGPARGALTLRLLPEPRLDAALQAGRLDLDPWLAALRDSASPNAALAGLPLGLDLAAEGATLRGVPLRGVRAALSRDGDRLALADGRATLPGELRVEADGTGTPGLSRVEASLRVLPGGDPRAALAALGWPLDALAPDRLRRGEGGARILVEEAQVSIPEATATLDGARLSGAGVFRFRQDGTRPALGLGLTADLLDLDGALAPGRDWAALLREAGGAGLDANLRVQAERAWLPGGTAVWRAGLDAALEEDRLTVRRLSGGIAGAEVTASGAASLGASPRLIGDATVEAVAPDPRGVLSLIPGGWPDATRLAGEGATLRLVASGAPEALALRGEADWAEARLEASGTFDATARRGTGTATLRHPGAPRLLSGLFGRGAADWLGEGSLSVVAALSGGPTGVAAERFDAVAGGLRASGRLALALDGARPRLTGRVAAEALPLPGPDAGSPEPLDLDPLRALDAEVSVAARALGPWGLPALDEVEGTLRLNDGVLRAEIARARLSGGALAASAVLDASGPTPRATLSGRLEGATLTGPLTGLPLDLTAGTLTLEGAVLAEGHSPSALVSTLTGEARAEAREGVLTGLDAGAALRAAREPGRAAEDALRAALLGGATAFTRLEVPMRLSAGRVVTEAARLSGQDGVDMGASGEVDLARRSADVAISILVPEEGAPPVGVRLTGPVERPRRVPDVAAWLLWRAERER